MPLIISLLLTVLRILGKFLIKLFWGQLIALFAMYAAAWIVKYYAEEIKNLVISFNEGVVSRIFEAESILIAFRQRMADAVATLIASFKERINTLMNAWSGEEMAAVLGKIDLDAWFAGLVGGLARSIGEKVHTAVYAGCDAARSAFYPLFFRYQELLATLDAVDQSIINETQAIYNRFFNAVSSQIETYNNAVASAFDAINGLADSLNASIDGIKTHVDAQAAAVAAQQANINADILAMRFFLEAQTITGPMNDQEARALAQNAISYLSTGPIPDHLTGIDFEALRIHAPALDNLTFDFQMPEFEALSQYNLDFILDHINAMCAMTSEITQALDGIAPTEGLDSGFLASLQADASTQLKQFLGIALMAALLAKRDAMLQAVDAFQADIGTQRQEISDEIVDKSRNIKTEVADFETETINNLPALMQPATDKFMAELESQMVTVKDKVIVNIDNIADTTDVDHLIETFPANIKAHADPNGKDSAKFQIGDIYRLLCDYFDRGSRIALMVHLAEQDITGNLEDLIKLPVLPAEGEENA